MAAERNKRYGELRARAAEVGLDLPETPPWESVQPPMPPAGAPMEADREAIRKDREAMREKLKSMTPEERRAMREAHWKEQRERAAERGIELPESPPWAEAEARYKAAQERLEQYRKLVDEMTDEQREAARALLGRGQPPAMQPPMGMPEPGGPQMGMPQMGMPEMGGPRMGMPQMGGPQMGMPEMGGPEGGPRMAPQMPPQMPPQMGGQMQDMPGQMPYRMSQPGGYGPQGGYPGYGAPYRGDRGPMPDYDGGPEQLPPPPQGYRNW
jgi:hypothetical protein